MKAGSPLCHLRVLLLSLLPIIPACQRSPEPEDDGLAAKYPFDIGIASDPAVIMASSFESENWLEDDFHFSRGPWKKVGYRTTDSGGVFTGNAGLEHLNRMGTHEGGMYDFPFPKVQGAVYLRWYRKYEPGFDFSCVIKGNGVYALAPNVESGKSAGKKPDGYDKYSLKIQTAEDKSTGLGDTTFYMYYPDQSSGFGDTLAQNIGTPALIKPGEWHSYEIMLNPNSADQEDGEIKMWIDGILKGLYKNIRFRNTSELQINELNVGAYVGGGCIAPKDQKVWQDNIVIATTYIGPMRRD